MPRWRVPQVHSRRPYDLPKVRYPPTSPFMSTWIARTRAVLIDCSRFEEMLEHLPGCGHALHGTVRILPVSIGDVRDRLRRQAEVVLDEPRAVIYDVSFPLFSKIRVLGGERHPVYAYLTAQNAPPKGPGDVDWNFEKFLVDRSGNVVGRYSPITAPLDGEITSALERLLEPART